MADKRYGAPSAASCPGETAKQTDEAGPEKPSCFVAYPSIPADRAESIEAATEQIQLGGVVDILGWRSLAVTGRLVIDKVCDEIRNRHIFVADVTGLNPNVLFELGYAIAHRKRIWLLLNPRIERARLQWDQFQLLMTVGFAPYSNSKEIVDQFYREQPFNNLDQDLYNDLLKAAGPTTKKDALLYLRCDIDTEASMRLARRVMSAPIPAVIDDPREIRVQPFAWYVQQVNSAFAVVCHLLSMEYRDWQLHNAKHALIAGLAHGRGKPLLLLAHEPYVPPFDYRDLLRKHNTATEAVSFFENWQLPYVEQYEKRLAEAAAYGAQARAQKSLRDITVGEPVAENESDSLPDYYVATAVYTETLNSKYSIVVGRKGSGKTATVYALIEELRGDPRNHVCDIKPVGYELEGLIGILHQELSRAEQGFLVESFWKFLLYTELAKSVYEQLLRKPSYYVRAPEEQALCEFVEQFQSLFLPDFSTRLETAVSHLRKVPNEPGADGRRLRISELLHQEMLGRLRNLLGDVLKSKRKVAVLVDNLDKAWNPNADLPILSDLLFGLLGVSRRIAGEFERDASGRAPINLFFALFLRSDIYAAMLQFAKEPDKLPVRTILWADPELLKRVIEQRFMKSGMGISYPREVWDKYFVPIVRGVPTPDYIGERILPRPRDLIYLIKSALRFAVNRGRTKIEEKDLLDADLQYSRFAADSLIVEARVRIACIEDLLLQFVQASEILSEKEIANAVRASGIAESEVESIISLLGQLTFIGFEVGPNRFEFLYDEQDAHKMSAMARKTAQDTTNGVRRFRIHPAFHAFLEIKPHNVTAPGQMTIRLS